VAQVGHGELADGVEIVDVARCGELPVISMHGLAQAELGGDVGDVVAVVGVSGPARVARAQAAQARLHRTRQVLDLRAGVVVIELARDAPALRFEQIADRVAQCRLARMPHMQRARRIGRDKLHQHLALGGCLVTELGALRQHLGHHGLACGGRQAQVDESGPGDFQRGDEALHCALPLQRADQRLGHFARWRSHGLGQLQCGRARQVAVGGELGRLESRNDPGPGADFAHRLVQRREQLLFGLDHGEILRFAFRTDANASHAHGLCRFVLMPLG
jgi:hypothetical protein